MGCEKVCQISAGGFPIPYVIDGYTSPTGSISQNPLILIFTDTDIFLVNFFLIDYFFWLIIILVTLKIIIRKRFKI